MFSTSFNNKKESGEQSQQNDTKTVKSCQHKNQDFDVW